MSFDEIYSWVKDLPIVDWHNHLDLEAIAADRPFGSLYEVWVKPDPYKHRAMRICGVPERLITGDAPEAEKMAAWEATLPKLVGNPLYAWSKLEMDFLKAHPLETLTPQKILKAFKVEYASPCVTPERLVGSAQRAGCPLPQAAGELLGRRASRPSGTGWTAAVVREFPCTCADTAGHYSPTLASGSSHRRHYPHIGQDSTLVCVTFRLADSLPESRLVELEERKREWLKSHPEPWDAATQGEWQTEIRAQIDKWLDAGHGECILADERCRRVVEEALEFFDANGRTEVCDGQDARRPGGTGPTGVPPVGRTRYRLHSYIVMPNHVHVLFELFSGADLARVIQSWKSFTAKRLNEILGRNGKVWREEYFDRLIRDSEHYNSVVRYIRSNGEVAKAMARMRTCVDGQDARRPGACVDGQDARRPGGPGPTGVPPVGGDGPRVVPSLRMNAGERIAYEVLQRFHDGGCRIVDISVDDEERLESEFDSLSTVAGFAAAHGWVMLLHLGALRETSARLLAVAGPAGGFAGMRGPVSSDKVARFLNRLECNGRDARCPSGGGRANGRDARCPSGGGRANGRDARCPSGGAATGPTGVPPVGGSPAAGPTGVPPVGSGSLPRTILMSLNPEAHAQLAILSGSFVEDGVPGKVQLGPAWWWCDHREGIFDVLEKNAAYGVLSTFIGMTTDSRSFLSFVRHDYFRRLLARWMAQKVADGDFPDDAAILRPICENICYNNAKRMIS